MARACRDPVVGRQAAAGQMMCLLGATSGKQSHKMWNIGPAVTADRAVSRVFFVERLPLEETPLRAEHAASASICLVHQSLVAWKCQPACGDHGQRRLVSAACMHGAFVWSCSTPAMVASRNRALWVLLVPSAGFVLSDLDMLTPDKDIYCQLPGSPVGNIRSVCSIKVRCTTLKALRVNL